ncbi:DUF4258 domain-containing protein [Jiella sonneratiae]|uniref:DUF4258 domain-containing protein n=1 Tax=Jiella sonneratiae TaxID=2816856 RepID=A0ABS3J9L6_9HYPH|nr:DUF4258 domain-containing protein [Jiella sonneratiae]MBO0905246.1 DUF4258 domain-containing protein [Jiella sonneratiae]
MSEGDKPVVLTRHAQTVQRERGIDLTWIMRTVEAPEWQENDRQWKGARRLFRSIPEFGGRVLRVVVMEEAAERRILTAFFDRRAGKR